MGGHLEEGSRRLWLNPGYRYITSTQKEAQRRDLAPCSTLQRGWAYSLPLPPIFFNLNFFLMETIFKVFIEFVTILLLLYIYIFLAMKHVKS